MAQNNPDEYAWQLFLALNRPAVAGPRGEADPNQSLSVFAPNTPVVWETWARNNGGRAGGVIHSPNLSEVYLDHGATPPAWLNLGPEKPKVFETDTGADATSKGVGFESRMNRATYDTVVHNQFYNVEGLEQAYLGALNGRPITFPAAAQEVKAAWARIRETDKPRYHWRTVRRSDGTVETWGLVSLHIITRDLQNWFWSDFQHTDYLELPVHALGLDPDEDLGEVPSRDSTTRGTTPPAAAVVNGKVLQGVRKETYGSKWQNYRLRGTQIAFTDANGYTLLASTVLEKGFQQTSSCITCHSRATIGMRSAPSQFPNTLTDLIQFSPILGGAVGNPDPQWYLNSTGQTAYVKTSFLWSMPYRAQSTRY